MKPKIISLPLSALMEKLSRLSSGSMILLSFASVILVGGVFLYLPISAAPGKTVAWIDALFISASAVCVTGLTPVDVGTTFSLFGQLMTLLLIQIGGVGVMALSSFFFLSLGRQVSIKQRLMIQDTFTSDYEVRLHSLVKSIAYFVAIIEGIGAICLFPIFIEKYSVLRALYYAVYHSVSAFCNAGFSLLPNSLSDYCFNPWLNIIIILLIVLGGIGFFVLLELLETRKRGDRRFRLSLHTKIVLNTTAILIIGGTLVLWFLERNNTAISPTFLTKFWPALFQSVTPRTAGFNTVDIGMLSNASLLFIIFLMFVGASPGSTGGGIKTTTFAVIVMLFWNRIKGEDNVNILKKTIPGELVIRSIAIFIATTSVLFLFVFLLLLFDTSEPGSGHGKLMYYFFEATSAIGTVGLSINFTGKMNVMGKLLIILLMYFGRVGLMALIYQAVETKKKTPLEYAEEGAMIG